MIGLSFSGLYQQKIFAWKLIFVPVKGVGLKTVEIKIHSESKKKLDSIHPSLAGSLRPDLWWQRRNLSVSLKNIISGVVSIYLLCVFIGASTNLVKNSGRTTKFSREP